jgi:UDP-arabinose 4-epimerase
MSRDSILVTGGSGYIGSHTCKLLSQKGFTPVVIDRNPIPDFLKWGPYYQGSIADEALVSEVIGTHKPVACIHFAAFISVSDSVTDPESYYRNNVMESLSFLSHLRKNGIQNSVFSSTAAVYGNPGIETIPETTPKQPINPYGHGKLVIEEVLRNYDHAYGLKSVAFRYFNAAGADPDAEIGEAHDPETHLIPLVLDAAIGRRSHISIFGDDYNTPDGSCVRDYIHVNDLAEAHILAVDYLRNGYTPLVYGCQSLQIPMPHRRLNLDNTGPILKSRELDFDQ